MVFLSLYENFAILEFLILDTIDLFFDRKMYLICTLPHPPNTFYHYS